MPLYYPKQLSKGESFMAAHVSPYTSFVLLSQSTVKGFFYFLIETDVSWILFPVVVESMSKSAFLDMLKSSSDKARTQETNEKQKEKVINVNLLTKPSHPR